MVTFKSYLSEQYLPLYKEIRRNNNTIITLLSETNVVKEIRDFDKYM